MDFWFAPENERLWFKRDDAFDQRCAKALGDLQKQAATGALTAWQETPEGCLALILLLDQASRNLFRGGPQAFANDPAAVALARRMVQRGWDLRLAPDQRVFVYLPFEHSEDLCDQYLSVALIGALPDLDYKPWAVAHLEIIERFGRFPHRNAALGRESTPEEQAYLDEPGSGF
ncbi:MAG: DUF924 family protein [Pseudomonadota bacterium]